MYSVCDIIASSESILRRVNQIDISIKNIKDRLEQLIAKYDGNIHKMSDMDISQYNEYHAHLDYLLNECVELLNKDAVDKFYLDVNKEIDEITKTGYHRYE